MKKEIILFAMCLVLPLMVAAKDVVYLNNGNVVSGKVVENNNGDIVIKVDGGEMLEYSQFEYYKLELGEKAPKIKKQRRYVSFEDRPRRLYFFAFELSGSGTIELHRKQAIPVEISMVNGVHLGQFFNIGAGVGVRYYVSNGNVRVGRSPWTFPVYLNLRGNILSHDGRNLVPYWSLDTGYNIGDNGGFFFTPSLGLSIGGMRNNFTVGLFYTGQFVKHPLQSSIKKNTMLDGLGLRVGFQF